jgi:hypothetical protein
VVHHVRVSYDVYVWGRYEGDVHKLLDALSEEDAGLLDADPAVGRFRRALLAALPELADVIEPRGGARGHEARYVALTLPFGWTDKLPVVLDLVAAHGLDGWDPQLDEPLMSPASQRGMSRRPQIDGPWSRDDLRNLGVSDRFVARAWELASLPTTATFGQAVGAYMVATALRDGASLSPSAALAVIADVASRCARGVPQEDAMIRVADGYWTSLGCARAVADGRY